MSKSKPKNFMDRQRDDYNDDYGSDYKDNKDRRREKRMRNLIRSKNVHSIAKIYDDEYDEDA